MALSSRLKNKINSYIQNDSRYNIEKSSHLEFTKLRLGLAVICKISLGWLRTLFIKANTMR